MSETDSGDAVEYDMEDTVEKALFWKTYTERANDSTRRKKHLLSAKGVFEGSLWIQC